MHNIFFIILPLLKLLIYTFSTDDCDDDKQIDECEEDIFPPEIKASHGILRCSDKIYPSVEDAVNCFRMPGLVSAYDDCMETVVSFAGKDKTGCSANVEITAVAQGCGARPQDTTTLVIPIKIDNDPPVVSCNLGTQGMTGSGHGIYRDLQFVYSATDGGSACTATEDLKVIIEVFSTEVMTNGEGVSNQVIDSSCAFVTIT